MSKYNKRIKNVQEYIKNTKAKVKFNDGTEQILPLNHIGLKGIAVKHTAFIKKNNIKNAYPYKILKIIEHEN